MAISDGASEPSDKLRPWDPAEHLETAEDMAAYLDAALEEGHAALAVAALGDLVRAKGTAEIARKSGRDPEWLGRVPSPEGSPDLATVLKVVRFLGISLHAKAR